MANESKIMDDFVSAIVVHRQIIEASSNLTWEGDTHFEFVVEKPNLNKRYVMPMDGTELADGTIAYAMLDHTGVWTVKGYAEEQSAIAFGSTVTQADIDAAPDWVRAIKPVEVTDDEK